MRTFRTNPAYTSCNILRTRSSVNRAVPVAIIVAIVVYLIEVFVDNNFARVKWQIMFKSAWIVALVCGILNFFLLTLL